MLWQISRNYTQTISVLNLQTGIMVLKIKINIWEINLDLMQIGNALVIGEE